MKYFEDYKKVDLSKLKKSGIYQQSVIKAIENNDYKALADRVVISKEQSEDLDYMGPIVYAYKEHNGSYIGYKYCGEKLQKNLDFAIHIIDEEPEVIEGTDASADAIFIQEVAPHKPEVIKHMSEDLKSDTSFTKELCELNIEEVTNKVAQECKMPDTIIENVELANNAIFMKSAIKENENIMKYATEELKNDYQFVKEICKENKKAIDYVAEHTEEFGNNGINAAKEELVENSTCRAIEEMKGELENAKKEKERIESQKEFDENSEEYKQIKIKIRQLNNNMNFIERIKNGEVKQERAIRLINMLCENLGEEYREEILKYIKMDDVVIEIKNKEKENKKMEDDNKEESLVTITDLDEITAEASLEGVEEETKLTKEEVLQERSSTKEIGEKTNGSYDERA